MNNTTKGAKYDDAGNDPGALLADDRWVAEQKLDGVRVLAHVADGRVRFMGANGSPVNFAAAAQWFDRLESDLLGRGVPDGTVLDGELLLADGTFHVFDLPALPKLVDVGHPLHHRRMVLERLADLTGITIVAQARTTAEKVALWDAVQRAGAEGIVVKRADAPYASGKRTADIRKVKITRTIDAVVVERNRGGSENMVLGLMRDGHLVEIGACSAIGKGDPAVGDVVEVTFLYLADGGRLYQPRMMRVRPDKTAAECEWAQVNGAGTSRAVVGLPAAV